MRNRKLLNYKFRRQQQLGYRIVDFVCYEKKLVIELDGIHHMEDIKIIEDQDRSNELQDMGFRVLRFSNEEVIYGFAMVIDKIQDELDK
ncbi:MAG TPA: endonuclease domain-containing protein [Candidatus Cloacimonadota bacterium]|nr:endonuclease domain-containing protein [Candidatus Cloacimonadota bacterium]